MNSILAISGNLHSTRVSMSKFDLIRLSDNTTLIEACMKNNDIDCMNVVLDSIKESKFSMNVETMVILMC